MRWIVMLMFASSVARADSKADVEALIKRNLDTIVANDWKAFDATFRKDGYYFLLATGPVHLNEHFHGSHPFNIKQTIDHMTVVADDATKVAWFNVQFSAHYDIAMLGENNKPMSGDDTTRMVGIAINDGGWKIAAAAYGDAFADKYLYNKVEEPDKQPLVFKGERSSAEYVQRWFTKGMLPDQAPGMVAVNGTAVGEWAVGTNAAKLVGAWDKLKLVPLKITGRRWKTYPVALITADVAMPVKPGAGGIVKEAGVVKMRLFAVVIPDGKAWKWTMLSFTSWFDVDMYPDKSAPSP